MYNALRSLLSDGDFQVVEHSRCRLKLHGSNGYRVICSNLPLVRISGTSTEQRPMGASGSSARSTWSWRQCGSVHRDGIW